MRRSLGSIDTRNGRHRARIRIDDKVVTIGTFGSIEEAESAIALFAQANARSVRSLACRFGHGAAMAREA